MTIAEEKAQCFAEKVRTSGELTGRAIAEAATTPDGVDTLKLMGMLGVVLEVQESGRRYIAELIAPLEENEEYQRLLRRLAFSQGVLGSHDAFAGEPPQEPDEAYLASYCDGMIAKDELKWPT